MKKIINREEQVADILVNIWHEVGRAVYDSKHPFRLMQVATSKEDQPFLRTMVLRDFNSKTKELSFFTDVRSAKVQHLEHNPKGAILAWNPRKSLQLRWQGEFAVIVDGAENEAYFNSQAINNYQDYSGLAPGTPLDPAPDQTNESQEEARRNFCLLKFSPSNLDALQLDRKEHLRLTAEYQNSELVRCGFLAS
jgi:hypothetical protein